MVLCIANTIIFKAISFICLYMFFWKFLAKFRQNILYNLLIDHNFDRLTRKSNRHKKRGKSPREFSRTFIVQYSSPYPAFLSTLHYSIIKSGLTAMLRLYKVFQHLFLNFGSVLYGSVLSYQQKVNTPDNDILNHPQPTFPNFPLPLF